MTITADLQTRLAGLGVEVFAPEDREVPSRYTSATDRQGRPSSEGPRGLAAYLAAHPDGYVQIEEAQGISADGDLSTLWVTVGCVARGQVACQALHAAVRQALMGTLSSREPTGPYQLRLPDSPHVLEADVYLCRPTFEITLIGELIAG